MQVVFRAVHVLAVYCLLVRLVAAAPPSEQLFPATTRAWISTPGLAAADAAGKASALGQLLEDPALKPFIESVEQAEASPRMAIEEASGLAWEELLEISTGEVAAGVCEMSDASAAAAVSVVVDQYDPRLQQVLTDSGARLQAAGARLRVEQYAGVEMRIYSRDDNDPVIQALVDDLFITTNHQDLTKTLIERAKSHTDASLASVEGFATTLEMAANDEEPLTPHFRFFVDLISLLEILSEQDELDQEAGALTPRQWAAKHGFDALRAIGGVGLLGLPELDLVYRVGCFVPPPYEKSMKMVRLLDEEFSAPLDWIPQNSVSFQTIHWDLSEIIPNLGPLYDEMAGDGIEGTFEDTLSDLKAPDGPRVDLQRDLFQMLGPRVHVVRQLLFPIGPRSDCDSLLVDVGTNGAAVARAVRRLLRDDPTTRRSRIVGHEFDLWQIGVPSNPNQVVSNDNQFVKFTTTGAMVANGFLVIATNFDIMGNLLGSAGQDSTLAEAADFQRAANWLEEHAGNIGFLRTISRLNRDVHVTYELARRGEIETAETTYASLIRYVLSETGETEEVDYALLPDYGSVEPYLDISAVQGRLDSRGWIFDGAIFTPLTRP